MLVLVFDIAPMIIWPGEKTKISEVGKIWIVLIFSAWLVLTVKS